MQLLTIIYWYKAAHLCVCVCVRVCVPLDPFLCVLYFLLQILLSRSFKASTQDTEVTKAWNPSLIINTSPHSEPVKSVCSHHGYLLYHGLHYREAHLVPPEEPVNQRLQHRASVCNLHFSHARCVILGKRSSLWTYEKQRIDFQVGGVLYSDIVSVCLQGFSTQFYIRLVVTALPYKSYVVFSGGWFHVDFVSNNNKSSSG